MGLFDYLAQHFSFLPLLLLQSNCILSRSLTTSITNEPLAERGISVDTSCFRCKESCENINPVFRKCSDSLKIWEDVCKGITKTGPFNVDWCDWMFQNLKCSTMILGRFPAYILFAVNLWFIWKWRCKSVFDISFKTPVSAGRIIIDYVEEWLKANTDCSSKNVMKTCPIIWSPPEYDYVKLNIDGSLNLELGTISARGLIRNHTKKWLGGFALNKGIGSIIEAELWGIFEGLQLVWKAGFKKVMVESDSQTCVCLLSTDTPMNHPLYSIILACKDLMEKNWYCSIHHVYREGNRAADGLAKLGHSLDLGITIFDDPPTQILNILADDLNGLATARLVPVF